MSIQDPFAPQPPGTGIQDPFEAAPPPPAEGGIQDPFAAAPPAKAPAPLLSRGEHAVATVTDIWPKTKEAFTKGMGEVDKHLNPASDDFRKEQDAYLKEIGESAWYDLRPTLKSIGRTGKGILGAAEAAGSILTGPGRSILGHTLGVAQPKMTAEELDAAADTAMSALRPTGAPVRLPGPRLPPGKFETAKDPWSWDAQGGKAPSRAPEAPEPNGPLGVTLSEGQETGNLAKIQAEQGAYRGEQGAKAQERAIEFYEGQQPAEVAAAKEAVNQQLAPALPAPRMQTQEAAQVLTDALSQQRATQETGLTRAGNLLTQAGEAIRTRLSPTGGVLAENPMEAAHIASGAIARAEEQAKAATDAAYTRFRELPGTFHPASFNQVAKEIKEIVARPEDPTQLTRINAQTTPQAHSALGDLQDILGGIAQKRDPDTKRVLPRTPVTPDLVENARRRLNTFYGDALAAARSSNNWADVRAMEKVIGAFDDIVLQKLRAKNFTGGDPEAVIQSLQEARAAHRQHRQTYFSRGSNDKVGPKIQEILGKHEGQAATPETVSSTLYGNNGKMIGERLIEIFGANSPEIGAIKQGLFSHIMEAQPGAAVWGPEKIADRIEQFTRGKGRSLTETYLNPQEVHTLQQYATQLRAYGRQIDATMDPVDRIFARITGGDGAPAASIQDTISQLFGAGLRNARYAPEVTQRIYDRFGVNSPQGGAFRQGLFHHAIEEGVAEKTYGPSKIADNLTKLANSQVGRTAYTPEQLGAIRELANLHRKLIIPARGANFSGTAAATKPMLDKILNTVTSGVAAVIAHSVAPGGLMGLPEVAAAWGAHKITPDLASRRAAKQIAKQLPLVADQLNAYQRKLKAYNKTQNPLTSKALGVGAANLSKSLSNMGIDLTRIPNLQMPGLAPADEKNRAEGGSVTEEDPLPFDVAALPSPTPTVPQPVDGNIPIPDAALTAPPAVDPAHEANEAREMAAMRQKNAVVPHLGRNEGMTTKVLQHVGEDIQKIFARPKHIIQGLAEVPLGQPLSERPDIVDAAAMSALDVVGMPGVMGRGVAKGALTSGAASKTPTELHSGDKSGATGGLNLYSHLEQTLANAKQTKAHPEQWANWLRNQPGVKAEELEWLGLADPKNLPADWKKGVITKDELLEHMRAGGPGVKEVEKRGGKGGDPHEVAFEEVQDEFFSRYPRENAGAYRRWRETPEGEAAYEEAYKQAKASTKYHDYQLPGGENYREVLLTMPQKEQRAFDKLSPEEKTSLKQQYEKDFGKGSLENQHDLREYYDQYLQRDTPAKADYRSSHWPDDPNPLFHMRVNDREIPGVGKSLHVEELQSDWMQSMRKQRNAVADYVDKNFDDLAAKLVKDGVVQKVCD